MATEIEVQHIPMVQSEEQSSTKSPSEIYGATNGIKDHEKWVNESSEKSLKDDSSLSVIGVGDSQPYSDGQWNGQLDHHIDSGNQVSNQGDAATNVQVARIKIGTGDPISPSNLTSEYDLDRILIDTTAPFESVKEAVSKFGGIVDWKAHKVQTVERRKIIERELVKAQRDIPLYKEQSDKAEQSKIQTLQDLENTKRLIEDLKLNLERAQTEERQAKQDSELAHLRVEEMEQGIAHEASVAAKTQLEVAKSRHEAAIADLKAVKDELQKVRDDHAILLTEKDDALKKAKDAVNESKEVEKTVENLTVELISTKELLESAHAAHLEAEEHRIGAIMEKDQDKLTREKELTQAEEDLAKLNMQIESAKDLKSKLNTASTLLADLKAELAAYMESKIIQEVTGDKTHAGMQSAVTAANKELEEVKVHIEKATDEVNCLKLAAISLKLELEKEKSELDNLRQREGVASVAVSSLEAELERIKSEIGEVQAMEKEAREKMMELPKQLQLASEEANVAKSAVVLAREELKKAKEEAEQAKAGANTMESRLLAAQKEIEAAKASERLAMAAIKALQESGATQIVSNDEDTSSGVTLSLDEYYALSKRAHEAEEEANMKVTSAMSQIDVAKASELRSLTQLEEANREVEERKEVLKIAEEKAEKATEGKLGVEQELRKWRAENGERRKAGELGPSSVNSPRRSIEEGQGVKGIERSSDSSIYGQEIKIERVVDSNSSHVPFGQGLGLKNLAQIANPTGSSQQSTTPNSFSDESVNSPKGTFGQSNTMKKKRRSLFPRFFMFLARRKSSSKNS